MLIGMRPLAASRQRRKSRGHPKDAEGLARIDQMVRPR
jgi:hypothetical protein